jgi:hypothetical protein
MLTNLTNDDYHLTPVSDEVDIVSNFVDILTVDNLERDIETSHPKNGLPHRDNCSTIFAL